MTWRQRERVPLPKGAVLTIKGLVVINDDDAEQVAMGSSCLVYHGHIKNDEEEGFVSNSVMIKEFYPDIMNEDTVFDIVRDEETHQLVISELTKEKEEYAMRLAQFVQGLASQKELASSEAMEIAVKPIAFGQYGDSYYIICDAHRGADLKHVVPETLKEKMNVVTRVAETMAILHETGYMMPDFKPSNLFWIHKPNLVKIIDTDSLILYKDQSDIEKKRLFGDLAYMSPDIQRLKSFAEQGLSAKKFEQKKRFFLKPISDMYAIGAYIYELFWTESFEGKDICELNAEKLTGDFVSLYAKENISESKLRQLASGLIEVLNHLLISDLLERKLRCYENAGELMKDLNEIYFGFTSEKFVPRKEIARANATFVAYNMLQKEPLFEYADTNDEILQLKAAIVGNHAMRKEMLSAMITIGQMTDAKLTISVVSDDAKEFWGDYISPEKNQALTDAITWSVDGQMMNEEVDKTLVARSLAHINIVTGITDAVLSTLKEEGYRYFVLLSEEEKANQRWGDKLAEKGVFIGCLQAQEKTRFYPISAECYSEHYNEKMFEEKIFDMGLMVHAYYCGCLDHIDAMDMEQLKEEFSANLYNVASSERCALHAMYKLACVGLYGNVPRKTKRFEKILEDPKVLEKLAWLEHLSWTADLLTSGATPLRMKDFAKFAYQGNNDWKNKTDPEHLNHPLLVASRMELPVANWCEKENFDQLDELDRVSYGIYNWFIEQKECFREDISCLLEEWMPDDEKEIFIKERIRAVIDQCIDGIGLGTMNQDQTNIKEWKRLAEEAKPYSVVIKKIENAMRPVVDSYKDRDFKELDRKLVYVVADIAG